MKTSSSGAGAPPANGSAAAVEGIAVEKKSINSELWQAWKIHDDGSFFFQNWAI
ncbi:hypothetical protein ACS0TY_032132 [Phlomoides rotata]